ncbi:unnamed protein product [Umbelopsis ramanniana]
MDIDSPPLSERMEIDDPWSSNLVVLDTMWANDHQGGLTPIDVRLLIELEHIVDVGMKEAGPLSSPRDLELEWGEPLPLEDLLEEEMAGPSSPQDPPEAVKSSDTGSSEPAQIPKGHCLSRQGRLMKLAKFRL